MIDLARSLAEAVTGWTRVAEVMFPQYDPGPVKGVIDPGCQKREPSQSVLKGYESTLTKSVFEVKVVALKAALSC